MCEMNLILVSIGNFQEYILFNISQLIKLKISNIYIITNKCYFDKFDSYKDTVNLIDVNELNDSYSFFNKTSLNKQFRNGFWTFTSLRFFYIYELMKKYNLTNCIHIENDVILYYNINNIINNFDKKYFYIPFDTYNRNIASIIFIPDHTIFKTILDNYNFSKNDMENFSLIKHKTGLIQNLPIFTSQYANTNEELFVSENFDNFKYIFDAAAIGQFLGGVDPRNISGNTCGFVNETCIIKYNKFNIIWKLDNDNIRKPYLIINDNIIPIFNLHIHSKNLSNFI